MRSWLKFLPLSVGLICLIAFLAWWTAPNPQPLKPRVPVEYKTASTSKSATVITEALIPGSGKPSDLPGDWPQFRGPGRDNIASTTRSLARAWPADGPKVLWRIPVGEGHAGAAVNQGRVYLVDYDREKKADAIRCLSLADGAEIWRYTYPVEIKRNHGMSRTVPAVTDRYVVALGPKCHVHCLDALTGKLIWKMDLVRQFKAKVPPWYAGQCPVIEGDKAILAPGGKPLMMAVELASGRVVWQTPADQDNRGMTHSSIAPMTLNGIRQYVYATEQGVVSVAAADGRILWTHPGWKIGIANVPTPVQVGPDRIFFCGGYNAGSMMLQLTAKGQATETKELYRLKATVFSCEQQTPIFYRDRLYSVIPSGELACLELGGKRLWDSGGDRRFGLGPFLIVNGLALVLDDEKGTLHLAEIGAGYKELAKAKLLGGSDAWGPMAFADGRLILRDLTEMICVDLAG